MGERDEDREEQTDPRPGYFRPTGRLVALDCNRGELFACGDSHRIPLNARPVSQPEIVTGIPIGTRLSEHMEYVEREAPEEANAFWYGRRIPGPEEGQFSVAVAYYSIPEKDWERARCLDIRDDKFGGFFYQEEGSSTS